MSEKDERSLEERIEQFYENQALPYDMLGDLRDMIEENGEERYPQRIAITRGSFSRHSLERWSPVAALAMLVICFGIAFFSLQRNSNQRHLENVAAEIALNHAKQFNTEFDTPSIAALSGEMTLLDFEPVLPKRLQYDSYKVDGARYCTIDSAIAVQVHMRDEAANEYTLYQFRDEPRLPLTDEKVIAVQGIQVTLWREGEVVMGLAERVNE